MEIINPELLVFSARDLFAITPLLVLVSGAVLGLILCTLRPSQAKWPVFWVSIACLVVAVFMNYARVSDEPHVLFNKMMVVDGFSYYFSIVFLGSAWATIMTSLRYLDKEAMQIPEYHVLILFAVIGMVLMASALDLIVVFIALEILSLSVYSLVAFRRADRKANEASLKYFILGGAASAVLLYGVALLYGVTGSTNIMDILAFVQARSSEGLPSLFALGIWLVIAGFLFKVAAVPFHTWMPDVYEGAPTPVTGFMTTGLKAAAFASFLRVFVATGYGKGLAESIENHLHDILWVTAVATMFVGNVVALRQTQLKRILAYSSIAHTGYLLVGFLSGARSEYGYAPILFYLTSYAVMNLGAFGILAVMGGRGDTGLMLQDLSGISRRHPWLAFSMAVFLLSMAGVPPTVGFVAKYLLFYSAVQSGEIFLVILSVLCSAISVYYYLRILVFMYMRDPAGSPSYERVSGLAAISLALMVALTLQAGVLPTDWIEIARKAVVNL